MGLNFTLLKKRKKIFKRITGLSAEEFEKVIEKVRPEWEKIEAQKKCKGRPSNLPRLEDKVLCLLIYYRTYITHLFLGYLFHLDDSNVCRLFKKIEPLLAKKVTIKKDRNLSQEEILRLLADVT